MEIKRIKEQSIHDAINKVREELGPDAVILSTEKNRHGVEIIAALDFDASVLEEKLSEQPSGNAFIDTHVVGEGVSEAIEKMLHKQFNEKMPQIKELMTKLQTEIKQHQNNIYKPLSKKLDYLQKSMQEKHLQAQQQYASSLAVLEKQIAQLNHQFSHYITDTLPDEINSIMEIHEEIGDLKDVLGCQTKLMDWERWGKNNPSGISLISGLVNAGFGVDLSKKVLSGINNISSIDSAWKNITEILASGIRLPDARLLEHGGVVMVMGRTGVGKTTTLAKLATRYVIAHGPNDVAFINLDSKRIGGFDQLDTYGRILNVPVYRPDDEESVRSILNVIKSKLLVLVDTAGTIKPSEEMKAFIAALEEHNITTHKLLLMSANTQLHSLKEVVADFKECSPSGCVITKTDESSQLGNVLTVSIEDHLPVYYETFGQQVPQDFSEIDSVSLIQRAFERIDLTRQSLDDDSLILEGLKSHANAE